MTDMLYRARERAKKAKLGRDSDSDEDVENVPDSPTPQGDNPSPPRCRRLPADPFETPVRNAITSLRATSSAFLVSSSPIQASSDPPPNPTTEISPEKPTDVFLLAAEPSTALERELQAALKQAQEKNKQQKRQLVAMQSALVLNGTYVDVVRGQLEAQEQKKRRGNKKGRLVGDGLPRLLTSRDFVRQVAEFEQAATEKAEALERRKVTREEKSDALKRWKLLDDQRKERNKEIKRDHAIRVTEWEAERDLAKQQHRRPGWKKPSLKGLLFSPLPKPGYAVEKGDRAVDPDTDDENGDKGDKDNDGSDDSDSNSSDDSDSG
jgi:hypothetical protein